MLRDEGHVHVVALLAEGIPAWFDSAFGVLGTLECISARSAATSLDESDA